MSSLIEMERDDRTMFVPAVAVHHGGSDKFVGCLMGSWYPNFETLTSYMGIPDPYLMAPGMNIHLHIELKLRLCGVVPPLTCRIKNLIRPFL
jgi:hypothetical protein